MRLYEEFKKDGTFWLPQSPDQPMTGTLSIKDGGSVELQFSDAFLLLPSYQSALDVINKTKRLFGMVHGGLYVILEGCRSANEPKVMPGLLNPLVYAKVVIVGRDKKISSRNQKILFHDFSFSVDGLSDWTRIGGPQTKSEDSSHFLSGNQKKIESADINIEVHPPNPVKLNPADGIGINLLWFYTKQYKRTPNSFLSPSLEISPHTRFEVRCDKKKSVDNMGEIIRRITCLVGFAMRENLNSLDWRATLKETDDVEVYCETKNFSKPIRSSTGLIVPFDFGKIRERADDVFKRWFDGYDRAEMVFDAYFDLCLNEPTNLVNFFLDWIRALDAYYKRMSIPTSKERNQRQEPPASEEECLCFAEMFCVLFRPFAYYFGGEHKVRRIIYSIETRRNQFVHAGIKFDSLSKDLSTITDLCEILRALLEFHFLDMLNFSNQEIWEIATMSKCKKIKEVINYQLGLEESRWDTIED